jgi:hypothetical protein
MRPEAENVRVSVPRTEAASVVASYLLLRRVIGWIGTLLPIVLVVGDAAFSSAPLPISLSDYYYTPMRNIMVGSLCVLGVFLLLYDVGVRLDHWVTNFAGVGVLGVAFLPGSPEVAHLTTSEEVIGNVHVVFASIAFVAFSITTWRFARADSDGPNAVAPSKGACTFYRASSLVMLAFIILSGVAILVPVSIQDDTKVLFILEALACMTFGMSFLVKGQGLQPLLSAPGIALVRNAGQGGSGAAAPEDVS